MYVLKKRSNVELYILSADGVQNNFYVSDSLAQIVAGQS